MPKGKRNPKASRAGAITESTSRRRAIKNEVASDSVVSNGIQCEMGIETLRKYWKDPNDGVEESTTLPSVVCNVELTDDDQSEREQPNRDATPKEGDTPVGNTDGNEDQSGSERNSPSPCQVLVKLEPEDGHSAVESGHDLIVESDNDKENASTTDPSIDPQVKIEQHDTGEGSGNSGIIIINSGGNASVTAPPALHWIIPKALNMVSDLVKRKVITANGDIQASITLASSVPLGGEDDHLICAKSTEIFDNTQVPKTVTGNEECSENSSLDSAVKSELLTCGDCIDVFTDPLEYEKHCANHNNREPFKCLYCNRRFNEKDELSAHMNDHSEKSFLCGKCGKNFSHHEIFIAHCKSHDQDSLDDPMKKVEIVKTESLANMFVCSQCEKEFRDADSLKHHEFTHSEGELFPCDQCGKTFRDEDHLMTHLKNHLKKQTCDLCGTVFTNLFDFNEHYITHKHGLKMYQCVVCKIACDNILSLRRHAAIHGLKVRWCGDCGGSGHTEFSDGVEYSEDTICLDEELFTLDDVNETDKHPELSASACEEDPLRLDDLQGQILSSELEELEVEVKVDDVLMEDEVIEDCNSVEEVDVTSDVDTKEEIQEPVKSKKRKQRGKAKETPLKVPKTRAKRRKEQPSVFEAAPGKKSKTTKKEDDESQLEVRLELRERSKRRKSNGRGQESVLLAT